MTKVPDLYYLIKQNFPSLSLGIGNGELPISKNEELSPSSNTLHNPHEQALENCPNPNSYISGEISIP